VACDLLLCDSETYPMYSDIFAVCCGRCGERKVVGVVSQVMARLLMLRQATASSSRALPSA
jgi:hypothetical protein